MTFGGAAQGVLNAMLGAATKEAGGAWSSIQTSVIQEFQVLVLRLTQIRDGLEGGDMTQDDANDFFAVVRNHAVEAVAVATTLVRAAVQKIVDAAISAAQVAINKLVGIALV